jgi:hypothetical protein
MGRGDIFQFVGQARRRRTHAALPRRHDLVDRTLIRWMLRLTPAERLQVLQDHINLVSSLRRGSSPK